MPGTTARDHVRPIRTIATLNSIDYLCFVVAYSKATTPNGQLLGIQLGSLYSPLTNTGIIDPTRERLLAFNDGWTDEDLDAAIADLVASGQWDVELDGTGQVLRFIPLFHDELLARQREVRKAVRGSRDHFIVIARYSRMTTQQRLAAIKAVSTIPCYENDMGYDRDDWRNAPYRSAEARYHYTVLFRALWFMRKDDEGLEFVHHMAELPKDLNSLSAVVPMEELAAYCRTDAATLREELLSGPKQALFDIVERPDGLLFAPTWLLHQLVWTLQKIPGGGQRNLWEKEHGFYPDPDTEIPSSHRIEDADTHRPIPGYHWLYVEEVRNEHGVYVPIQVGETTQTGQARHGQHLHNPTNPYANQVISRLIAQNNPPRLRVVDIVHYDEIAETETALIERLVAEGHHLNNWIIDPWENRSTIRPDRRILAMPTNQRRAALDAARRTFNALVLADREASQPVLTEEDAALRDFYEHYDPTEDYAHAY